MKIEGYSPEEILALPQELLDSMVFSGNPVVFVAGTAEILGEFKKLDDRLVITLAHIDGGGEGVLPALWKIGQDIARQRGFRLMEWIVQAVACERPNPKLRRVLEKKGFEIKKQPDGGSAFHLLCLVKES